IKHSDEQTSETHMHTHTTYAFTHHTPASHECFAQPHSPAGHCRVRSLSAASSPTIRPLTPRSHIIIRAALIPTPQTTRAHTHTHTHREGRRGREIAAS